MGFGIADTPDGSRCLESEPEMATSKKDASTAGKLLSNPKTPKSVKSVAASDLAQAKSKGKGK